MPELVVEADFTTPALQIPLDWVDLSSRARAASVHAGRQRLLDRTEAGSASVILDNRDRALDPSIDANVRPLNHLRIRAIHDGIPYPLFQGFVSSWPQEWPADVDAISTVAAEDAFSLLARYELTGEAIAEMSSGEHIRTVLTSYGWPEAGSIPSGSSWWILGDAGSLLGTNTFLGASLSEIEDGTATIMALNLEGNLLEHLLNVAENTEGGTFYVGPAGELTFIGKPAPHQEIIGEWGDDPSENRYTELVVVYDNEQIYNDVRVTRRELETSSATDAGSIAVYGTRTLLVDDVLHSTEGAAVDQAALLLARYASPVLHPQRLVMRPKPDSPVWPLILGLRLMSAIIVRRRPPGGGDPIELRCLVIGIGYEALPDGSWEMAFDLAPHAVIEGAWYLGLAGSSELGSTTVLA